MKSEEIAEKYKDKYKDYNSNNAIAILIGLVAELNVKNKILFDTLEKNGIKIEMSDIEFTEQRNNETDKILSQVLNK